MPDHHKIESQNLTTKLCPYCRTPNKLNAVRCAYQYCGKRIGEVEKDGRAHKPTDWWSYISCSLWWLAFIFYMWILGWSKPLMHQIQLLAIWFWNVAVLLWNGMWNWFVSSWNGMWNWFVNLWNWLT